MPDTHNVRNSRELLHPSFLITIRPLGGTYLKSLGKRMRPPFAVPEKLTTKTRRGSCVYYAQNHAYVHPHAWSGWSRVGPRIGSPRRRQRYTYVYNNFLPSSTYLPACARTTTTMTTAARAGGHPFPIPRRRGTAIRSDGTGRTFRVNKPTIRALFVNRVGMSNRNDELCLSQT